MAWETNDRVSGRTGRAPAVALVAALIAGAASGTATAAAPDVAIEGCIESFTLVPGDEAAIRAAVPSRHALGGEVPVAHLWSISSTCERIRLGGGPARRGTLAFIGAGIEAAPEEGAPGSNPIHSYLFWVATSDRAVARALAAAHFPASWVPAARHTLTPGLVLRHGMLDVPLAASPYRIGSAETPATTHPHAHDASWWVDTPGGPRRILVHHPLSTENAADCGIATTPGSRLARLLGASEKATLCFIQGPGNTSIEF